MKEKFETPEVEIIMFEEGGIDTSETTLPFGGSGEQNDDDAL